MRAGDVRSFVLPAIGVALTALLPRPAAAGFDLGPEELVRANDVEIVVTGYSVPSFAPWNSDNLPDLVVGDGGGASTQGKVRVYLNIGTLSQPRFGDFFYAQSNGSDLICPASGCLGCFPRTIYWDGDARKDLLIGQCDGLVKIFLNTGSDDAPEFDGGTVLQVGPPGAKIDMDVGARATPTVVDWNNDGKKDLVVGAADAKIHFFINEGTDTAPDFVSEQFAQENGLPLLVPTQRSSPHVQDLDHDGKKDLLTGNTEGQLLLYSNVGADAAPLFSGYTLVAADGVPIDLAGTPRSRPFVCEWTGDGLADALIGSGDGKVRLYQGVYGTAPVAEDRRPGTPWALGLLPAYPNPCRAGATIGFVLPGTQRVRLTMHDAAGRRVTLLADERFASGNHQVLWNGVDGDGRSVPPGLYFLRMETEGSITLGKLTVIR